MQQAQGLQGINRDALGNYSQNMVTQQGSPGLLSNVSPALGTIGGTIIGGAIGGPPGDLIGSQLGNAAFNGSGNKVGQNTIPNWSSASPNVPQRTTWQDQRF